jgi:hypothetical protein
MPNDDSWIEIITDRRRRSRSSRVRVLKSRVGDLNRLLGRETLELKVLEEALAAAPGDSQLAIAVAVITPQKLPHLPVVLAFGSGGSRQGYTVDTAFGANAAATSTNAYNGCDDVSSGSTSIGVWHDRTNSRGTL